MQSPSPQPGTEDPVVVVGFAFRLPQDAVSEDAFWDIIVHGRSTMTDVPESRYNIKGHHSSLPGRSDSIVSRGGHFIDGDISLFDAPFFKMGAAEAKGMDPQLRLLLETTYHSFESAGIKLDTAQGSNTSVYVGSLSQDYNKLFNYDSQVNPTYQATGCCSSMLSSRVSWFYDLRGPSVTVNTACSSSLVGMHLGCQSLLTGESDMSLVGGAQLQLEPMCMTSSLSRLGFLSGDSQCYSFDDRANGYSRGEGIGMVVLKRLSKAMRDGDTIRAVIRGTAVNQNGRSQSITQPSAAAQASMIQSAYKSAGLDFATTGYFEGHGTGTAVGDPIETQGISEAFTEHRLPGKPLYVGSVKANIGHLESVAGIAGLIKTIMVLEKAIIAPNALLKNLNSRILAENWKLEFPTLALPWPDEGLRRASVNSFGFGGTNAHVVVDDALHYLEMNGLHASHNTVRRGVLPPCSENNTDPYGGGAQTNGVTLSEPKQMLFLISSEDENGIRRQATALEAHLRGVQPHVSPYYLQDLAYTLSAKRTALPWKSFALASSVDALCNELSSPQDPVRAKGEPIVNFVFTGQGAQWAAMGKELLSYPVFKQSLDDCDDFLKQMGSEWSLIEELFSPAVTSHIDEPRLAQPLCTALQVALVDLLFSWGIVPHAVVGHSSGEIAAAYCAGYLNKETALRVALFRGMSASRMLQNSEGPKGSMLAVGLSEDELRPYIASLSVCSETAGVSCGCINSPKSTTVTGDEHLIDELEGKLQEDKVFARKLNVPIAYHSHHMQASADYYRNCLHGQMKSPFDQQLNGSSTRPSFHSSVTGRASSFDELLSADYWVTNLVSQVKFSEALEDLCAFVGKDANKDQGVIKPITYLLEIGPHCALERPIRDTVMQGNSLVTYDYALRRNVSSIETLVQMAGRLLVNGYPVDLHAINNVAVGSRPPKQLLDLPYYKFNHSQSYWSESRMSQNIRRRQNPRHELLGTQCMDWNPFRPKWRLTIREADLPWLVDHKINDTILYPAAGMIAMVLEGMRSLKPDMSRCDGFRLRDVTITSALVIPSDDTGIEAQLHMTARAGAANKEAPSYDFTIYSVVGEDWKTHCSGKVFTEQNGISEISRQENTGSDQLKAGAAEISELRGRCTGDIDKKQFYRDMEQVGYHYGESFQNLRSIRFNRNDKEACAGLSLGDWKQRAHHHELSEHLIHPAVLDSMTHVVLACLYSQRRSLPAFVPTTLSDVFVSSALITEDVGAALDVHGKVTKQGLFSVEGDIIAVHATTGRELIALRGLGTLAAQAMGNGTANGPEATTLFHQTVWKPDITMLSSDEIIKYCQSSLKQTALTGGIDPKDEIICRYFLSNMIKDIPHEKQLQPHLVKYVSWAQSLLEDNAGADVWTKLAKSWPEFENDASRSSLIEEYASSNALRRYVVSHGERLPQVLRGDVDPAQDMFNEDSFIESVYQSPALSPSRQLVAVYMDLLAHKSSDIRILEVGGGTGCATAPIVETLSRHGRFDGLSQRFVQYDFTDISSAFLSKAQERFTAYNRSMNFTLLDIENDPKSQGFTAASYDVVIASLVIHSTSNVHKALRNIRGLLKPGGKLVLTEPTNLRSPNVPYFFGTLQSWWPSTDENRVSGSLLEVSAWRNILVQAGFNGPEVSLADADDEESHLVSMIVSSVPSEPQILPASDLLPSIIAAETPYQYDVATFLRDNLPLPIKDSCEILSLQELSLRTSPCDKCICLFELRSPSLARLSSNQFEAMQSMLVISNQVIWINDKCGETADIPESGIISGFARSIMRELPLLKFVHCNVGHEARPEQLILSLVTQSYNVSAKDQESDLLCENGKVLIPRVVEAPQVNQLCDAEGHDSAPQPTEVSGSENVAGIQAMELQFTPGRLDSLHFESRGPAPGVVADDQLRVLVKATGINFKDVMVALGQLSDDHIGQEFAGVVVDVGINLQANFAPGDRVCGVCHGSFRTYIDSKSTHLIRIPPHMSFTEASAIPVAFATAQYGLGHLARLQKGEAILIHAAAGAVGQAAIQLAQRTGAELYVTVSTLKKKSFLMEQYGVASDRFFSSRDTSFVSKIMQATNGKGVDVVINSLAGQLLTESWRCVAPFGRFVEIGKRDISTFQNLPMEPFLRNVSFHSLDLSLVSNINHPLMGRIMMEVQDIVFGDSMNKICAPQPVTVYQRSGFEDAFRLLQTGQHIGKVVVDWEQRDVVQMIPRSPLDYKFQQDATYVIAGGLGGIGRSMASWLCDNGARNLILLSRSGPKSDVAKRLLSSLIDRGVDVYAPICDVSDPSAVAAVVDYAKSHMPPIKGCIQAAMTVENRLFSRYSLNDFQAAFAPKISGTMNLDRLLPPGMDFFVMLSSLSAIHGAAAQTNYGGANAFLDAFARHRHARGERCISLSMAIVEDIGYVAEHTDVAESMAMTYFDNKTLQEGDLHFALKYACNPSLILSSGWETQVLCALTTPAFVKRQGNMQDLSWMHLPVFRHMYRMEQQCQPGGNENANDSDNSGAAQLRATTNMPEAAAVATVLIAQRLARSLTMPVEDIDVNKPPFAYGVDSLVAVELLAWFANEIGAVVPVLQILSNSTIAQLGVLAAQKSSHVNRETAG